MSSHKVTPPNQNVPQEEDTPENRPQSQQAYFSDETKRDDGLRRLLSAERLDVKMPTDVYERDVEVTVECPTRVVMRLERMMGSDRALITNASYMKELLSQVELEETETWQRKTRKRHRREEIRVRKLAIAGLMEPTDDMQDLYKHPIYRVNKILKRLNLMDINMKPIHELPPITPIEPMVSPNPNGEVFKYYPGHSGDSLKVNAEFYETRAAKLVYSLNQGTLALNRKEPELESEYEVDDIDFAESDAESLNEDEGEASELDEYVPQTHPVTSKTSKMVSGSGLRENASRAHPVTSKTSKMVSGSGLRENASRTHPVASKTSKMSTKKPQSKTEIQKMFGDDKGAQIESNWRPYRSDLVDRLFATELKKEMFQTAQSIVRVYKREGALSNEFCSRLGKLLLQQALNKA